MKISKVLITGIAGSGGSYLSEYICENHSNVKIHGLAYSSSSKDNLKSIADKICLHEADLMDFDSVNSVLQEVQPDVIFHLAAFANVRASFAGRGGIATLDHEPPDISVWLRSRQRHST